MKLEWKDVDKLVLSLLSRNALFNLPLPHQHLVYGVPRGGVYVALAICRKLSNLVLVEDPIDADIIVDDLIDSGKTLNFYKSKYPTKPFYALIDKRGTDVSWVSFPWERMGGESGPSDAVVRVLQYIGEDPNREGLQDTPRRVVKAYDEMFSGYKFSEQDVASILTCFKDGVCDEMVVLRNIEFHSFCEHHMLPFTGVAHVGYLPDQKVVGVSKLARIVDVYSRRLQIQERLTQQVTSALDQHLKPRGSACVVVARHSCMSCRGVGKRQTEMITSSITGAFRELAVRQEFFSLIKS